MLEVRNLVKHFPVRKGWLQRVKGAVHAVDGISFSLKNHETLGIVGESGCGKSTAGRTILRLIEPTSGEVFFRGRDIFRMEHRELKALRREMQIIFQDPYGSLNPRLTVSRILEEPLLTHKMGTRAERRRAVEEVLERVGLLPEHMHRFPHEFSGGQRQRIMIARALILKPRLIIGDEPVSALDVSVQAQILNLLGRLQREAGFSLVIISHDLGVIRYICHRVAVMYLGKIVELAPADALYREPLHPYTQALLSAVPVPDPRRRRQRIVLAGDVPSPLHPPSGCRFHPRCPRRLDVCPREEPPMRDMGDGRRVACHLHGEGRLWEPSWSGAA
ncbi:oligopeptide transport system ATP-binding protein [Desulfacinum infernum DSM 9756]|uniref:Oligopeptide transport system ATP-binding protein n=1 Tax=Desulfacinum infernum DSM 9756 TaxID=1121391 RepID=A0A1M4XWG6_9BACT|nr:dipeptide ABC transporter ATP-binding protein [Desulfacinum infernum]SHE97686.1 oligopeptide transport system ATP-binding protein [Desulfacinum infernum DSM 9756]